MDGRDRTLEVSVDDAERSKRTRIRHGARSMKCERIREREGIEVEREDALRRFILAVVSKTRPTKHYGKMASAANEI